VNLTTSGGTAPYRFSVDGAPFGATYSGTTSFTVTAAGTYSILVEDANGCQRSASVDVQDIPPPVFNIVGQDANCGGANDGRVTINVTNGYGYEIEYSINNGATFQISNVFSNLAPGSYNVVLRYEQDSFTCTTAPQSATIGTPSTITATATPNTVPSCTNETGGQITISGVSGVNAISGSDNAILKITEDSGSTVISTTNNVAIRLSHNSTGQIRSGVQVTSTGTNGYGVQVSRGSLIHIKSGATITGDSSKDSIDGILGAKIDIDYGATVQSVVCASDNQTMVFLNGSSGNYPSPTIGSNCITVKY